VENFRIILATVVTLAAGIGISVPRAFSQPPAPSYQQTLSLDGAQAGQPGYNQINVAGPPVFGLTGLDSTAQTDIETTATTVDNVETLNGTTQSVVTLTSGSTASSTTYASAVANYFVEVDGPIPQGGVLLDIVGTVSGSVGAAQGEASGAIGFADTDIEEFDIKTGAPDISPSPSPSLLGTYTIPDNEPHIMELNTFASVSGGTGPVTVFAKIDPYVLIDPSVKNPELYTFKFFVTPVPEPTVWMMLLGGLGLVLTFQCIPSALRGKRPCEVVNTFKDASGGASPRRNPGPLSLREKSTPA